MIFRDIERQIHPQRVINKVVFDLDQLLRQPGEPDGAPDNCLLAVAKEQLKLGHARKHSNSRYIQQINTREVYFHSVVYLLMALFSSRSLSEGERSSPEETARPLKFESRLESGNLRKAIQVFTVILVLRINRQEEIGN